MFVVEHPKRGSRFVEADGEVEENAGFIRVSKPVENEAADIGIVEEDVEFQEISADRAGVGQILAIAAAGDVEIDSADRTILDQASAVTRQIGDAQRQLDDAQARYDGLLADQVRLRDNLRVVQSDDLRRRYETTLGETEDEISALLLRMEVARSTMSEGERDLEDIILLFR